MTREEEKWCGVKEGKAIQFGWYQIVLCYHRALISEKNCKFNSRQYLFQLMIAIMKLRSHHLGFCYILDQMISITCRQPDSPSVQALMKLHGNQLCHEHFYDCTVIFISTHCELGSLAESKLSSQLIYCSAIIQRYR